jgi:hypothetical protein
MRAFSLLALAAVPLAAAWNPLVVSGNGDVKVNSQWSYVDCGNPSDVIQLKSLTVSPDPPQPGQDLTINASGYVSETIQEGSYADVTVKLGLVKLLTKKFDVCDEARNANADIQCPVDPGEYTISQTVQLPKEIPKAKFVVQVRAYTDDDADMLCLNLLVDFLPKKPWLLGGN